MSEIRVLIEQLVESGVDPIEAAEIITRAAIHGASSAPKAKSAGAIRQERYRRNKASQVTECDALSKGQKEISPTPPKEKTTPKEKTPKGVQKKAPKAILEGVLSQAIAAAVVDHRAKMRKPLTDRAAELLAKHLQAAPETCGLSPDQAADLMIYKGWQGFEPEWARNAVRSGYSANPKPVREVTPDEDMAPETLEAEWQKRLSYARRNRSWFSAVWGPMPGDAGCRVPSSLLQTTDGKDKRGFRWDDQSRRIA